MEFLNLFYKCFCLYKNFVIEKKNFFLFKEYRQRECDKLYIIVCDCKQLLCKVIKMEKQ